MKFKDYLLGLGLGVALLASPVYAKHKDKPKETQLWMFTNRIQMEISLLTKFDILICDRTIFDTIAYTRYFGFDKLADKILSKNMLQRIEDMNVCKVNAGSQHSDCQLGFLKILNVLVDIFRRLSKVLFCLA